MDQKQVDGTACHTLQGKAREVKELWPGESGAELMDDELEQVSGGNQVSVEQNSKSVCKYLM